MPLIDSPHGGEILEIERDDSSSKQCVDDVGSVPLSRTVVSSISQKALLENNKEPLASEQKAPSQKPKKHLLPLFIRSQTAGFQKNNSPTFLELSSATLLTPPSKIFRRIAEKKDEISRAVATAGLHGLKEGINLPFVGEIRWEVLKKASKDWLRNPKNLAVLIWGIAVGVSGAILFLVMVGFLDKELPHKSQRDAWFEVNNQILNALFTLMCLYHHPGRFYHLTLLCRWNPDDVVNLRKIYCKNGTYKPHEWTHMMVVVLLLHLNCFAQYALCALNWGYKRSERPAIGVGICIAFAIGAPAAAGLYNILSPLGKEYEIEADLEAVNNTDTLQLKWNSEIDLQKEGTCIDKSNIKMFQKRYFFASRESKRLELEPKWNGGILDCWTDPAVAIFSCLGGFCVFGWNMDRLGFGNMYVHIVTFILLCMAPFWIFNLAAVNIDNARVREFLCITGIVLCVFGLLYGGFWRIQMRKRFNLPASRWCFGQPNATDCAQWLFCSLCSLCQEVRTADFYDICEEKMYATQPPNQNSLGHAGTSTGSSSLCQEHRSPMLQSTVGNSPSCVALVQSPLNAPAPLSFSRSPIDLFQGSANSACLSPLPQHEGLPVLSPQYLSSPMFESPIQNSLASDSESELKEECQVKMPEAKDSWTPTSALVFQLRREKCMEL